MGHTHRDRTVTVDGRRIRYDRRLMLYVVAGRRFHDIQSVREWMRGQPSTTQPLRPAGAGIGLSAETTCRGS